MTLTLALFPIERLNGHTLTVNKDKGSITGSCLKRWPKGNEKVIKGCKEERTLGGTGFAVHLGTCCILPCFPNLSSIEEHRSFRYKLLILGRCFNELLLKE